MAAKRAASRRLSASGSCRPRSRLSTPAFGLQPIDSLRYSAVRNGKAIEVPDETWMSGIGVRAADKMLADVAKATGVELT